jgi:hypothetical protein
MNPGFGEMSKQTLAAAGALVAMGGFVKRLIYNIPARLTRRS